MVPSQDAQEYPRLFRFMSMYLCDGIEQTVKPQYCSFHGVLTPQYFLKTMQVYSAVELTEEVGAYRLAVNFSSSEQSTKCLYWNSEAEDVEAALEALDNVDSVLVERVGGGTADDK